MAGCPATPPSGCALPDDTEALRKPCGRAGSLAKAAALRSALTWCELDPNARVDIDLENEQIRIAGRAE